MACAIMVKHFKHSSCFHMRFNINKKHEKTPRKQEVHSALAFTHDPCWVHMPPVRPGGMSPLKRA